MLHSFISLIGVYGVSDHSREPHTGPQDTPWNYTGQLFSNSAAVTPFRLGTPTSEGKTSRPTTSSSEHTHRKAGVFLERPRPLHKIVPGNNADLSPFVPPIPMASLKATGAGASFSTDDFNHLLSRSRGFSIASRSTPMSAPAYTDDPRVVQSSDAGRGRTLTSGGNRSSTPTWSLPQPIARLASASSVVGTIASGVVNRGSRNASTSSTSMAAASGSGESPKLVEYLESIKNRTENGNKISPWLGPRPLDSRPVRLHLSRILGTGPFATSSAKATGGERLSSTTFNTIPSGTGANSALRSHLASTKINKTGGRYLQGATTHKPLFGFLLSGFNTSTFNQTNHQLGLVFGGLNITTCSGSATSTAHVVYEVVTSTILVNETITLGQNATTPLPVFMTPPPACQIITAPCEGVYCPSQPAYSPIYGPNPKQGKQPLPEPSFSSSTATSTLLVTKKTAAIVQQLSAVGNLFGPSTPIAPGVAAQPNSDGQQAAEQKSGSSSPEMSTESDDSSLSDPGLSNESPNESNPQKNPTNDNSPSASSNSQDSDSQKPPGGSREDQTGKNGDGTNSNGNGEAPLSHGDKPSDGHLSGNGDTSSNGANSDSGKSAGAISSNEKASNAGEASKDGGVSKNGGSSGNEGSIASNGAVSKPDKGSSSEIGREPEGENSADSQRAQYVPSIIMAGILPVSIVSDAVIVGSHTVKAGSLPTTVVASGQTIAIQSSRIVAQGKTIPIQAAVTPPPANSAMLGNVRIVLRPQDVKIGSKTYERGSSPTSVVYRGQTYSWDASHLFGAGATVAFPSADSSAPRITAGGQVFSVFPSQLKAPGRNILLPTVAKPSPFVYKGRTFSINPSQIIAPDTSITLPPVRKVTSFIYIDHTLSVDASNFMARLTTVPLSSGFGIVTYNGQVLTIKPSKIIGPSTTVALVAPDESAASPTAVTTGGLTFSIGPLAAVVGSTTYSFVPGKSPATIMTHDEAVLVGSNGVQFGNINVPIPTNTPSFSAITQGDLAFSIAPSEVVVGGHTETIHSDMIPITTVVHGHTMSIGPEGVGLPSTTIPLPTPKPSFSLATEGDVTFSVAHSEVVVKGKTFSVASNMAPVTTVIDGQNMTIGPKGIHIKGATINLPAIQTPISVTAAGLTFLVGATDAVVDGTRYAIGSGALLQTVVVGSQSMEIGSAGVILPSTTIAPEQTPVAVTAGGLTFSMDSTEAIINGTTYSIGIGASAKTLVRGSMTMVLGTDGVALPSTTIRPWSKVAQTSFPPAFSTSSASSTTTAPRPLTPIVTGKEIVDGKHAVGMSTRVSNFNTLLGLLLGVLIPGLRLI